MASSTQNVKLGVCKITFGGQDLGYTKGGVEVEVTTDTHKSTVDQFGNTPIGEMIIGRSIVVRAPLAETTVENLAKIMPGTTVANGKATVNVAMGMDLRSIAQELTLHPVALDESNTSEDLVIPLAATPGAATFAYKVDEERVFNVEFTGYPDETGKLFTFGGPAPVQGG